MPYSRDVSVRIPADWRVRLSDTEVYQLRIRSDVNILNILLNVCLKDERLYDLIFEDYALLRQGVHIVLHSSVYEGVTVTITSRELYDTLNEEFNLIVISTM